MNASGGIEERYGNYDWKGTNDQLRWGARMIQRMGWVFFIAGLVVSAFAVLSRLPTSLLPFRYVILGLSVVAGLVLCILCWSFSALLTVAIDIEDHVRCAKNVWLVLEERDFSDTK